MTTPASSSSSENGNSHNTPNPAAGASVTSGHFIRYATVDPGMLPHPAQPAPKLAAYKEFGHWSTAMKAYLIGGGFWPYVVEIGYGEEPQDPGVAGDQAQYRMSLFHREMNTTVGKELLFQALGEDASAGFREEPTLKAVLGQGPC